jgi:DNA repair exonuclease SbcCD ATPase subunit
MENQTQSAKELKAELKSIASKIATVKKDRRRLAHQEYKKKQAEAKAAIAANADESKVVETEKTVFEAAIANVKDVAAKANAKAVKAAKTVAKSPETVQAAKDILDAVKAGADTTEDMYCVMSVLLVDKKTKMKVIRKNGIFYLVNQSTNVFGVNTDIISEHADKSLAVKALATKLNDFADQ